jgi:hypothetical protein
MKKRMEDCALFPFSASISIIIVPDRMANNKEKIGEAKNE